MTQQEAHDAAFDAFETAWAGAAPLEWPNRPLDTSGLQAWARLSMQYAAGDQENLGGPGGRLFRYVGELTVQVFTRAGGGLAASDALVEAAMSVLRGGSLGAVTVRGPTPTTVGRDGAWWQVNVSSVFQYDLVD